MRHNVYLYIFVMALTTYLVRMLPFTLFRKEIKNTYVKSFLAYVPYATLAAMTFPAILFSTSDVVSAAAGFAVALFMAYKGKSLTVVAACACVAVFAAELLVAG